MFFGPAASEPAPRPQHIDVRVQFWSRRSEAAAILEIAEARILSRSFLLAPASWNSFDEVAVDASGRRVESFFSLVPTLDPDGRVEASTGEVLHLEFRPSRGSEKWARPWVDLPIGVKDPRR
jgi:hypothetical protein